MCRQRRQCGVESGQGSAGVPLPHHIARAAGAAQAAVATQHRKWCSWCRPLDTLDKVRWAGRDHPAALPALAVPPKCDPRRWVASLPCSRVSDTFLHAQQPSHALSAVVPSWQAAAPGWRWAAPLVGGAALSLCLSMTIQARLEGTPAHVPPRTSGSVRVCKWLGSRTGRMMAAWAAARGSGTAHSPLWLALPGLVLPRELGWNGQAPRG